MVTYKCSKEGELATMAQQIKNIDDRTNRIETKLDKFIDSADDKYASKSEFEDFKTQISYKEKDLKSKVWDIVLKALPWIAMMFAIGVMKYYGG